MFVRQDTVMTVPRRMLHVYDRYERALCVWGMAVFVSALISYVRPAYLEYGLGGQIPSGMLEWTEPPDRPVGGCVWRLGTFYRCMHNLTTPYCLVMYIALFAGLYAWLSRSGHPRAIKALTIISLILHMAFFFGFAASRFMPSRSFTEVINTSKVETVKPERAQ